MQMPSIYTANYTMSEDCLYLSVYVPLNHNMSSASLAVQVSSFYSLVHFFNSRKVFFHGGDYNSGGEILYTGDILAGNDFIFVSANYRHSLFLSSLLLSKLMLKQTWRTRVLGPHSVAK